LQRRLAQHAFEAFDHGGPAARFHVEAGAQADGAAQAVIEREAERRRGEGVFVARRHACGR
jgi:hypothetical protein